MLQFKNSGFRLIWLDGSRQAAWKRFDDRAKAKSKSDAEYYLRMYEFYLQMYRIEATKIIETIKPAIINPCDNQERFKSPENLLEEIRKTRS